MSENEFAALSRKIILEERAKEAAQAQMELSQARRILQEDRRKKAQTAIVTNMVNDDLREAKLREQGRMGERRLQEQRKKTA
jgi:RecA/RadA recombinase